jgi:hypothetical protein
MSANEGSRGVRSLNRLAKSAAKGKTNIPILPPITENEETI